MVKPAERSLVDTRGLPEGYDPHKFYEYSSDLREQSATGLERFLYRLMPSNLIKSFAIAIDPLSVVKLSDGVISPANRLKYRATSSILDKRSYWYYRTNGGYGSSSNYQNIPGNVGPVEQFPRVVLNNVINPLSDQLPIPDYLNDSTRRTRRFGSDSGEMELFSGFINSPSRTVSQTYKEDGFFSLNDERHESHLTSLSGGLELTSYSTLGRSATLSPDVHTQLRDLERASAQGLMQKHALSLFRACNPQSRNYTFFRNLVELRDLPHSIAQLRQTIGDLRSLDSSLKIPSRLISKVRNLKTVLDDIPKEYLSYHFGWKQTMKDVNDLLRSPTKISKQINFLLTRDGKPTTYRAKRVIPSVSTGVSGFTYDSFPIEFDVQSSSRIERTTEVRCSLNTTFRFPNVDVPNFVDGLFADKLGIYPRFIDIYNLVPWTWLIDWFSGLGNYLEIIEDTNKDKSLINWGFLTADTTGKLLTDHTSKVQSHTIWASNLDSPFAPKVETFPVQAYNHQSTFDFHFQLRKDLATIMDVKTTSDPSTLSEYQKSILGAILQQHSDFRRSPAFRT